MPKPSRDKVTGQFVQTRELRADDNEHYRATICYYSDDGETIKRKVKGFKKDTPKESLEEAKLWIVFMIDPNHNCDWCICDDIGIELEGN